MSSKMSSHRKVARKKQTGAAAVLPVEKKRAICVIFMEKWQKWELGKGLIFISENGVLLAVHRGVQNRFSLINNNLDNQL